MPSDDKQFGRQRTKRIRPLTPSANESQAANELPNESQEINPPDPREETSAELTTQDISTHQQSEEQLNEHEITENAEPAETKNETTDNQQSAEGVSNPQQEQRRPDERERPRRDNRREKSDRHQRDRQERPEKPERRERRESRPERSEKSERPERFQTQENRNKDIPQKSRERNQTRRQFPERNRVRVSVIVPAYNEEGNIKPLLDQFNDIIHRAGSDWEVILVDDGSKDKTADRARDASIHYHWLRVVSYTPNRGLTAALEAGFKHARGSIFVFYPADLQYHPQDIPKMINRIDRGADVVTGWKQGKYQKKFVSFVYNRLCRVLFNVKVHDMNSVKAFKKEVLEKISLRQDWHRYIIVQAAELGFAIDEVKVPVYPRHSGQSKFGTGRILGGVLDLLSVKFQVSFTKKPLRFFGTWGLFSILLGMITGLIGVYERFFTDHGSRLWLFFVILFVLAGLMLFSLGFLAEVIVALREEIESLKNKNR